MTSALVLDAVARGELSLDDTIFTLKLTPNLAHCMSVFGVARDAAGRVPVKVVARVRASGTLVSAASPVD